MLNKFENINKENVDSMLGRLDNLNETKIDNFSKINDICYENTDGYCKEINNFLSKNIKKFDFENTYKKTLNTDIIPV